MMSSDNIIEIQRQPESNKNTLLCLLATYQVTHMYGVQCLQWFHHATMFHMSNTHLLHYVWNEEWISLWPLSGSGSFTQASTLAWITSLPCVQRSLCPWTQKHVHQTDIVMKHQSIKIIVWTSAISCFDLNWPPALSPQMLWQRFSQCLEGYKRSCCQSFWKRPCRPFLLLLKSMEQHVWTDD